MESISSSANQSHSKTPNRDLYSEVTAKIISLIDEGVTPWRRSWSTYGVARNYATQHIYTGINFLLMNNTSHPIPYFLTFKQANKLGAKIRKGAKSEMVFYFHFSYKDHTNSKISYEEFKEGLSKGLDVRVLKFLKYYNVFNIEDIVGIEPCFNHVTLLPNEKIESCENIVLDMPNAPKLVAIDSDRAFYSPLDDVVNMPFLNQFTSAEAFYATLFHELVHSTGHESRLARKEVMNTSSFGSQPYSQEELVAEIGSSFLCSMVQIDHDSIVENSAAYLAGWLKILKQDSKFLFTAAANAQKAADHIINGRTIGQLAKAGTQ